MNSSVWWCGSLLLQIFSVMEALARSHYSRKVSAGAIAESVHVCERTPNPLRV